MKMLITPDQIRAARALKGWSQGDLAQRTSLAVPTIANIEISKQTATAKTLQKIIDAFAIGGVRFTKNGVELDHNEIFTLTGDGKFINLLSDASHILSDMPPKEKQFYAINAEDILTTEEETLMYQEMLNNNISLKRIISEKAAISFNEFTTKLLPAQYADEQGAVFVYADKIVFYTSKDSARDATTLIITNVRIADIYKKIFAFMWDNLPEINKENKKAGK